MTVSPSGIRRIGIVGGGVIGGSWAAFYLSKGFDVIATDPSPNAETLLRDFVERAWANLEKIGLAPGASRDRLEFTPDLEKVAKSAGFIQENGPEREDLKIKLFADMDRVAPPSVILASSTSGIKMSLIQSKCQNHPERCVIGHPFNPPHLIPLVEVVGGEKTSAEVIQRTLSFYSDLGKKAIFIRKEVKGHVANRIQWALYREVLHLINEGVISVEDVDAAISYGPGLRWGIMGPNLLFQLGGGKGGIEHFLKHILEPVTHWWSELGNPELTPELQKKVIEGTKAEIGSRSLEDLEKERDRVLLSLLASRKNSI